MMRMMTLMKMAVVVGVQAEKRPRTGVGAGGKRKPASLPRIALPGCSPATCPAVPPSARLSYFANQKKPCRWIQDPPLAWSVFLSQVVPFPPVARPTSQQAEKGPRTGIRVGGKKTEHGGSPESLPYPADDRPPPAHLRRPLPVGLCRPKENPCKNSGPHLPPCRFFLPSFFASHVLPLTPVK